MVHWNVGMKYLIDLKMQMKIDMKLKKYHDKKFSETTGIEIQS